jgi:hypothetical protein
MFEQPENEHVYKCNKCKKYFKDTGLYTVWTSSDRKIRQVRICDNCFLTEKEKLITGE